jgi:hypothetical protein
MVMMAVEMEKAVAYGYRVGFEDGVTGEPFALTGRDEVESCTALTSKTR